MPTAQPPTEVRCSQEHLLGPTAHDHDREWVNMETLASQLPGEKNASQSEGVAAVGVPSSARGEFSCEASDGQRRSSQPAQYHVYRRRWFGLLQLVLLNIIVSWDWLTFSAISTTSAHYFGVSESAINWLSTGFLFAFVAISPVVIWALNRGPKPAIIAASILVLVGNWARYAGTRASGGHFGVVMFGQVLIGFAQPFVLAAPTRYSNLWFTEKGRISATAVASLANPFGGALGQLIDPFWATGPNEVPNMVLYIAIMSSVAAVPSFFIPAKPPSPPSASSSVPTVPLSKTFQALWRNAPFYLVLIPFSVYVGFFNAISSLLNQILEPYGFSETEAGICGALLIVVGLVTSAIVSPFLDRLPRNRRYLPAIKILVPTIAVSYLAFVFAPPTRTLAAPFVIASVLGAASFALVPVALEYLVEITSPVSPEVGSTLCWTGGQLLGAVFILIMAALRDGGAVVGTGGSDDHDERGSGDGGSRPPGNMQRALIFQAVVACVVVPLPLCLGVKRFGLGKGAQPGQGDGNRAISQS